jgi:hypothetical protein
MTMERWEEVRWHNTQRGQRVETANYVDVDTDNGAEGGGAVAREGAARDEQRQRRCVNTTDDDNDNDNRDDEFG